MCLSKKFSSAKGVGKVSMAVFLLLFICLVLPWEQAALAHEKARALPASSLIPNQSSDFYTLSKNQMWILLGIMTSAQQ